MKYTALSLLLLLTACGAEPSNSSSGNNGFVQDEVPGNNGGPDEPGNNGQVIELSLTEPTEGAVLTNSLVVVRGAITGTDEVLVAGTEARVENGEFVASLLLQDGTQTVTVAAGSKTATVSFTVDAQGPRIVVNSPPRGAFVDASRESEVVVRGFVEDAGGDVASATFNGEPLTLADDGTFEVVLTPRRGVNSLRIEAQDDAGNGSSAQRGLIYGDFEPVEGRAWNALTLETGTTLFPVIEEAILAAIDRETIDALIHQYGGGVDGLEILGVDFGEVDIVLEPRNGRLRARIWVYDLRIDVRITQDIMLTDIVLTGSVLADPAELSTDVYVSATPDGSIRASLGNARVTLTNFDLEIDGVLDVLANWLEDWIGTLAEDVLVNVVSKVVVDELFDPALLERGIEILGHRIDLSVLLTYMAIDENGVTVVADMETPPEAVMAGHEAPGVYTTEHETPFGRGERDVQLAFSDDFVNKVLFQFWRGGVLDIDFADLKGEDGVVSEQLTVQRFALIAGRDLLDHADPDTPVGIRMKHALPPIIAFEDGQVRVDMADVLVDLYIDDGTATRFATVALAMTLFIEITVTEDGPQLNFRTEASADLDDEPLFDMDDHTIEATIAALLETLPAIVGSQGLNSFFNLDGADVLGLYLTGGDVKVGDGYVTYDVGIDHR